MSDRALRIVALTSAIAVKKAEDLLRSPTEAAHASPSAVPRRPFERILVATDGTAAGDRAVSYAIALARDHHATLDLCTVVDGSVAISGLSLSSGADNQTQLMRILEDSARGILESANARALDAEIASSTSILFGHSADAIVTFATRCRADAIVVGTRGAHGLERFFLGSTAWDVLRASAIPTIVVPPNLAPHAEAYRILVALDDSQRSDETLKFAMRLAAAERALLVLCSVVATRDLYDKAMTYGYDPEPLRRDLHTTSSEVIRHHAAVVELHDLPHEVAIVEGVPAESILLVAKQHRVDAIVMGTHGRRGVERLYLGSVAEAVVREATVPVGLVRADDR